MDKILNLFVSKKHPNETLTKIQIKDGFVAATDSFKLIKISINEKEENELRALAVLGSLSIVNDRAEKFPDFSPLIPNDRILKEEYHLVTVSPVFLFQVAEAMKRMDTTKGLEAISMYVPKKITKPLVFKNKKAVALLMPTTDSTNL